MRATLTKISRPNVEGGLRTDTVVGRCHSLPTIGESFNMSAAPLESGDIRLISTSIVEEVESLNQCHYRFKTRTGSVYEVVIMT